MTAIDRTAYPRPGEKLTPDELDSRYRISETEHAFIRTTARSDAGRLTLAILLKARQDLGCFPSPAEIHSDTIAHLASQLAFGAAPTCNGLQSSAHGLAIIGGSGSRSLQLAKCVRLTIRATGLILNCDGLAIINSRLTIIATGGAARRAGKR